LMLLIRQQVNSAASIRQKSRHSRPRVMKQCFRGLDRFDTLTVV
jgi:hypothetical protein